MSSTEQDTFATTDPGSSTDDTMVTEEEIEDTEVDEETPTGDESPTECKKEAGLLGYDYETFLFILLLVILELIVVVLSLFVLKNGQDDRIANSLEGDLTKDPNFGEYYHLYIEIAVMIFLGFGLLMSFLKNHGSFAMSISFLLACVTIQYAIFVVGFSERIVEVYQGHEVDLSIVLNLPLMIKSLFASGVVLISFGVMIGKVTPLQMLLMVLFEIPFYALNVSVVEGIMGVSDVGGSMLVHTYGAYFGIACSWVASKTCEEKEKKNAANRVSDVLSMVGSIALWLLWPSFNGALGGDFRHRIAVNTYMCLVTCCICSFLLSRLLRRKFSMADLQNATLAGGVAIGGASNMVYPMAIPVLTGMAAAIVSVVGYAYLQELLYKKLKLHDTCGVNNLHGMPGILGGVVAAVVSFSSGTWSTVLYQFGGLAITFLLAFVPGIFCGIILRALSFIYPKKKEDYYEDETYFDVED